MKLPWAAYKFAVDHGLEAEAKQARARPVHPKIKPPSAVMTADLLDIFKERGVLDEFYQQVWPEGLTEVGSLKARFYARQRARNDSLLGAAPEPPIHDQEPEVEEEEAFASFALEAHLRDFIIENLRQISIGSARLQLYVDTKGRDGKEYPTDVGPIDILAVDEKGTFFVFELKLERGPDRALGQLARYMGWVKTELASGDDVRGVIVARSIDERLRYASSVIPNVALLEYHALHQNLYGPL